MSNDNTCSTRPSDWLQKAQEFMVATYGEKASQPDEEARSLWNQRLALLLAFAGHEARGRSVAGLLADTDRRASVLQRILSLTETPNSVNDALDSIRDIASRELGV